MKTRSFFLSTVLCFSVAASAVELHIATWSQEHLNANEEEGCIYRTQQDYDNITDLVNELKFDVVALTEVKDAAAAHRVFYEEDWNVEMSKRPKRKTTRECWGYTDRFLQHQATGIAIRKGVEYRRNDDMKSLSLDTDDNRWGVDITLLGETELRLLAVHLKSGCWSSDQDEDEGRERSCRILREQMNLLTGWRDARIEEGMPFLVLGDFNRNLSVADDWGWKILSSTDQPLSLLTAPIKPKCHERYDQLIDHIVADSLASEFFVEGTLNEGPRVAESPDHCAISAVFRF